MNGIAHHRLAANIAAEVESLLPLPSTTQRKTKRAYARWASEAFHWLFVCNGVLFLLFIILRSSGACRHHSETPRDAVASDDGRTGTDSAHAGRDGVGSLASLVQDVAPRVPAKTGAISPSASDAVSDSYLAANAS